MSPFVFAIGTEPLVLLPQKAVWLPQRKTLLVADAHIGKAVAFRALGVPVPRSTTSQTLDALSRLVDAHRARCIVLRGNHDERVGERIFAMADDRVLEVGVRG